MATLLPQQRLDRLRRLSPEAVDDFMRMHGSRSVLIYSMEHHAYWHRSGCGYTRWETAGEFTLREAWRMTSHCGPEKEIHYRLN